MTKGNHQIYIFASYIIAYLMFRICPLNFTRNIFKYASNFMKKICFWRQNYWDFVSVITKLHLSIEFQGFPGGSVDKESACNAGDLGLISESGRSPGEGNGNQLQYSCLGNPMDRGAWWATVHGVTELETTEWLNHHHHHHWISCWVDLIQK